MNTIQQTARVGLFFLLGLALTWVTFQTLSGGGIFRDKGYTVIAGFPSLKEVRAGDEVRLAGGTARAHGLRQGSKLKISFYKAKKTDAIRFSSNPAVQDDFH